MPIRVELVALLLFPLVLGPLVAHARLVRIGLIVVARSSMSRTMMMGGSTARGAALYLPMIRLSRIVVEPGTAAAAGSWILFTGSACCLPARSLTELAKL